MHGKHARLRISILSGVKNMVLPGIPLKRAQSSVTAIGSEFELRRSFGVEEVKQFSELTGDANPIHNSHDKAREQGFEGPIVPGLLCASLFPTIIAKHFPGAVYISQTLKFREPVQVGEEIIGRVILERHLQGYASFRTFCYLNEGEVVIEGGALARLP